MDLVVPFSGGTAELEEVRARLQQLKLRAGDTLLVVDNTPARAGQPVPETGVPVLRASELATPGYARNRGAAQGSAEWLVFIDADTVPEADLLDRYFDVAPSPRTALLAGHVSDEEVPPDAPAAQRYAYLWEALSQDRTFAFGEWAFAQTANVACRREAFSEVGGFREDIRAAEDADLTFRLRAAGWTIERRESARVVHRSRRTVLALMRQRAVHGAGNAWLDRQYPGSFPGRRWPGLVWWGIRTMASALVRAARGAGRDELLLGVLTPLWELAFEFGRSLSNERRPRGR